MKKILALLFVALATPAFADFTVNLDAGRLRLSLGTADAGRARFSFWSRRAEMGSFPIRSVPDNTHLAMTSCFQFCPVPGSSGAFNISGGTDETLNTLTISTTTFPALAVGDLFALRWFPQITQAQFQSGATPATGNYFGTYNPLFWSSGTNNPDGGQVWAVPSAGSTISGTRALLLRVWCAGSGIPCPAGTGFHVRRAADEIFTTRLRISG